MESLEDQIESSKALWKTWENYGADKVPITIDWNLFLGRETDPTALQKELIENGFNCEISESKFLWVFKHTNFDVTSPERIWTEDEFLETTKNIFQIVEKHGSIFDGCGAAMPEQS